MPMSTSSPLLTPPQSFNERGLDGLFLLQDRALIERVIAEAGYLMPLLREAQPRLIALFGAEATLRLGVDVGEPTTPAALVLEVQTHRPAVEARALLERFDETWWLDALPGAQGRLLVALGFA
jgi:hypothetical protein